MPLQPLVSFVVPCYNYGRFLRECLNGIFAQRTYDNIEVIVIDDCSTDDTWEILCQWNDSRLRCIRHDTNRGHVHTVNEGLAAARGQFVARIDPDDRYRPNFLETLLPEFHRSPRVGMVHGDAAIINADGDVTEQRATPPHNGEAFCGWALLNILRRNYICAPTAIARREAWQKHLPIWEGLAFNDIYFNIMMARDWDFAYVPTVVADYRVHGANHHSAIVLNKTEEASLLRVLDWVFAHEETNADYERKKQTHKRHIYANHFLNQAEKYFGAGYNRDARRCYWETFKRQPSRVLHPGPLRRFLATMISRRWYDGLKAGLLGRRADTASRKASPL